MPDGIYKYDNCDFEVALLGWDATAFPINWFPEGGAGQVSALVDTLNSGDIVNDLSLIYHTDAPLIIKCRDRQWLIVRDLVSAAGVAIALNANAERWRDGGLADLECSRITLCDDGTCETELCHHNAVFGTSSEKGIVGDLGRLAYYLRGASCEAVGNCLEALGRILGCGLKLELRNEDALSERVPVGMAAAVGAMMMLLCRRHGDTRCMRMCVEAKFDRLEMDFDFELYDASSIPVEGVKAMDEYAVIQRLSDRYNVTFDISSKEGRMRAFARVGNVEASYLGIKRPAELEYDNERSGNI